MLYLFVYYFFEISVLVKDERKTSKGLIVVLSGISDLIFGFWFEDLNLNDFLDCYIFGDDKGLELALKVKGEAIVNLYRNRQIVIYPEIKEIDVNVEEEIEGETVNWYLFNDTYYSLNNLDKENPKYEEYRQQLTKDLQELESLLRDIAFNFLVTDPYSLKSDIFFNSDTNPCVITPDNFFNFDIEIGEYISDDLQKVFDLSKRISDTLIKISEKNNS